MALSANTISEYPISKNQSKKLANSLSSSFSDFFKFSTNEDGLYKALLKSPARRITLKCEIPATLTISFECVVTTPCNPFSL